MTELVTLTIDDREVSVPKGTGLVESAAAAGIEIPVFCYEPRLGPPVGACRMGLVEIEGLPKLQAGCTLTAQEGMVVRTAASSEKAATQPPAPSEATQGSPEGSPAEPPASETRRGHPAAFTHCSAESATTEA